MRVDGAGVLVGAVGTGCAWIEWVGTGCAWVEWVGTGNLLLTYILLVAFRVHQ